MEGYERTLREKVMREGYERRYKWKVMREGYERRDLLTFFVKYFPHSSSPITVLAVPTYRLAR